MNRYWDCEGELESESTELQKLVPASGAADTLKGELWRAATKIYYDYYNNGWGNNWMGPADLLMSTFTLSLHVKTALKEHACNNMTDNNFDSVMEEMITAVITQLRDFTDGVNDKDMWEFRSGNFTFDPEWQYEDDEEDFFY